MLHLETRRTPVTGPGGAPPHIVYVSTAHTFGGAEEYLAQLASNVRGAGWRVSVVLPRRPYLAGMVEQLMAADVRVVSAAVKTQSDYPWPALLHLADVAQRHALRRLLHNLQPDLVHINQPYPESAQLAIEAAAGLPGVPVVTTVHLYESVRTRRHRLAALRDAVTDRHFGLVDAVTTPIATAGVELERQYARARGKIAGVLPHALDLTRFNPERTAPAAAAMRARLGAGEGAALVGVVGRLSPQKHQRATVSAWPAILRGVPGSRLVLAGDGPDRAALIALSRDLGIDQSVVFLGQVASRDMPALLGALDLVAMPSLHECMPIAMLEALAMARPVVATAVNAVPDVLEHEVSGLLVPAGDDNALAQAIIRLLRDSDDARRFGAAGRASILRRFAAGPQARAALDLYERLLTAAGR